MTAIGIDLGTTTISAVVFKKEASPGSEKGQVLEARTIPGGGFLKTSNEWERLQDPGEIVSQAKALLDELLLCYPDTESVGLTGQMHGIVYVDEEGRCISPLYTWQDGRGDLPGFGADGGETLVEWVQGETGQRVFSGYGLVTHLYHCQKNLIPAKGAGICTIADYLGMCLTGRKRPLMHISNGAGIGFFDCQEGVFRKEALRRLGVDALLLPELTKDFSCLGCYQEIPVSVAIGDSQASFLGTVGMKKNTVLLNMGTGGQISLLSEKYFEAPGIEARPLTEGKYLLTGSSLCGGRAYAVLERFLRSCARQAGAKDVPQYDLMGRLAQKGWQQRKSGMKVTTAFSGTRMDPGLRGSITGIGEENFTPEGLVYGVLEGMARELYDYYRTIREGTGICAEHLRASGNGVRKNPILQKIVSELFGAELELSPCEEEAACGAAFVSSMEKGKG